MANNNIQITVHTNAEQAGKSFGFLGSSISKSVSQANSLDRSFKFLDAAFNSGKIDIHQYARLTEKLDKEQTELYSSLGRTTSRLKAQGVVATESATRMSNAAEAASKLSRRQRLAGKSTNRFGMYAQQVGYQVGDFAVQVQSGTNALVAFGQQGTQLAGLLPGVYGAILGIGLSVTTAVLRSSGALEGLTFDFQRFKEDTLSFIDPIMPALRLLGDAFVFMGNVVVDSINLVINSFQYMVAIWKAVPDAFTAGVNWIMGQFRRLELSIEITSVKVQAAWQRMVDTISGSEAMVTTVSFDEQGNPVEELVSKVSELQYHIDSLETQYDVLGDILDDVGGSGRVLVDALKDVERIDIRNLLDYFSFGDKVEEEAGKAENALESLYSAMESSLENGFMSMIEGTKSVTDAFRDMARDIIKELYKVLVVQRMVGSVEQGTGLAGLLGKSLVGAGILPPGRASGGTVMSNQPYLVGEKGPEIIVPQNRGHVMNADLTSQAMGGGSVVVNQSFHFQANGDESVKKLIAQAAPQIANMAKQSVVDSRRRGGAMKNAFG